MLLLHGFPQDRSCWDRVAPALAEHHAARVEPVEARVTGDPTLSELAEHGAVALVPAGWPPTAGIAQLTVQDDVTLPLLVLWPIGRASAAVRRTREGMSGAQRSLSSAAIAGSG